jgi:hypothetical protein
VHCSAGISQLAFCVWLGASLLVTTHAIATQAAVFIVLGGVQIVATTVILFFSTKYASSYCGSHGPGDFDPRAETQPMVIGAGRGAGSRPWRSRMARIVVAETRNPGFSSSPRIRW